MANTIDALKPGDKCPKCGEGELVESPSGQNLICPKCGRMVIISAVPASQGQD